MRITILTFLLAVVLLASLPAQGTAQDTTTGGSGADSGSSQSSQTQDSSECTPEKVKQGECYDCLGKDQLDPNDPADKEEIEKELELDKASGWKRTCY